MKKCDKLTEMGRRQFLRGGAVAAAGGSAFAVLPAAAKAPGGLQPALIDYPSNRLANTKDLKLNEPVDIAYPEKNSPACPIASRTAAIA